MDLKMKDFNQNDYEVLKAVLAFADRYGSVNRGWYSVVSDSVGLMGTPRRQVFFENDLVFLAQRNDDNEWRVFQNRVKEHEVLWDEIKKASK